MKFGQLIRYNMRAIAEKLFPDPFLKNQNRAYLRISRLKFQSLFLLYAKWRAIKLY